MSAIKIAFGGPGLHVHLCGRVVRVGEWLALAKRLKSPLGVVSTVESLVVLICTGAVCLSNPFF